MKKTILTLCIGIMIGMLVGTTSGVFAAIGDVVEATVAEYNIVVDGKEQVLEVSPVAINDSTYVPLRAMANMMGKDVTYKADSRTIELTTPTVEGVENLSTNALTELEVINRKIESVKTSIYVKSEIEIESLKKSNPDDPRIAIKEQEIVVLEQQLAELEAQKAELEAQ